MLDNMGNAIKELTSYFWHCYGPIFGEYVNLVPTYVFIVLHKVFPNVLIFFCYIVCKFMGIWNSKSASC